MPQFQAFRVGQLQKLLHGEAFTVRRAEQVADAELVAGKITLQFEFVLPTPPWMSETFRWRL